MEMMVVKQAVLRPAHPCVAGPIQASETISSDSARHASPNSGRGVLRLAGTPDGRKGHPVNAKPVVPQELLYADKHRYVR